MKAIKTFTVAAAAFISATAMAGASQATIYIGLANSDVMGGATQEVQSGGTFAAFGGAFGAFELTFTSGANGLSPVLLGSTSHVQNSAAGGGVLDIYVTRTEIEGSPNPLAFFSSFTSNVLTSGWTLTERTYVGGALQKFGGTELSNYTFVPPGLGTFSHTEGAAPGDAYSVTHRYTVTAPTVGESLATISIAAVPEPGTWALMITGFGGAGAMLRTRRRHATTA